MPSVQSAYRQGHSTETALLKVISDIIDAADCQKVTLLGLLDMSAAFDTADHEILLRRLEVSLGVSGQAQDLNGSARSSPTDCNLLLSVAVYLLRRQLKDQLVVLLDKVRDLSVILNSRLTTEAHLANVVRSSLYYLRQLRRIRCSLTTDARRTLATAFAANQVDYCNAVLYGRLHLQWSSADYKWYSTPPLVSLSVLVNTSTSQFTPVLRGVLHWLPVPQRIQFKIAALTFDSVRLPAQSLTILTVLVSARPSVEICSFHKPEQLGSVGGAFSSQLQLSGTHCRFTFALRPSVAVSYEQGSRLIFSGWPFTDFSSEN